MPADDTALLLHYLRTHDAVCPLCKYNLRNLVVPRCPECGRAIRMTVGLVEQNLWAYVVLLVALLPPAGLGLAGWVELFRQGLNLYRPHFGFEIVTVVAFQGSLIPAVATVILRQRFLKLRSSTQARIAMIAVIGTAVLYGAFLAVEFH